MKDDDQKEPKEDPTRSQRLMSLLEQSKMFSKERLSTINDAFAIHQASEDIQHRFQHMINLMDTYQDLILFTTKVNPINKSSFTVKLTNDNDLTIKDSDYTFLFPVRQTDFDSIINHELQFLQEDIDQSYEDITAILKTMRKILK